MVATPSVRVLANAAPSAEGDGFGDGLYLREKWRSSYEKERGGEGCTSGPTPLTWSFHRFPFLGEFAATILSQRVDRRHP